jgi:phospholipase/lecithinase/hemolysin
MYTSTLYIAIILLKNVPGVRQQIEIYLNETDTDTIDVDQTIYTIWAGLNDFFFNDAISPSTIATSLLDATKDLITMGALNILVFNQPPLQSYPFIHMMGHGINFNAFTVQLNANLSNGVAVLQCDNPKISLRVFDIYSLISKIVASDSTYLFENTVDTCWNVTNGTVTQQCADPASYVFIDDYHFTSHVHELISADVRQFLSSSSHTNNTPYPIFVLF